MIYVARRSKVERLMRDSVLDGVRVSSDAARKLDAKMDAAGNAAGRDALVLLTEVLAALIEADGR